MDEVTQFKVRKDHMAEPCINREHGIKRYYSRGFQALKTNSETFPNVTTQRTGRMRNNRYNEHDMAYPKQIRTFPNETKIARQKVSSSIQSKIVYSKVVVYSNLVPLVFQNKRTIYQQIRQVIQKMLCNLPKWLNMKNKNRTPRSTKK